MFNNAMEKDGRPAIERCTLPVAQSHFWAADSSPAVSYILGLKKNCGRRATEQNVWLYGQSWRPIRINHISYPQRSLVKAVPRLFRPSMISRNCARISDHSSPPVGNKK
jgi:hypothetical protein